MYWLIYSTCGMCTKKSPIQTTFKAKCDPTQFTNCWPSLPQNSVCLQIISLKANTWECTHQISGLTRLFWPVSTVWFMWNLKFPKVWDKESVCEFINKSKKYVWKMKGVVVYCKMIKVVCYLNKSMLSYCSPLLLLLNVILCTIPLIFLWM